MTEDEPRFSERQRRAFEALDREEQPAKVAAAAPAPAKTAAAAAPVPLRPGVRKPDSPTSAVISGFIMAIVGSAMVGFGGSANGDSLAGLIVLIVGGVLALAGSVLLAAGIIAMGVRWGMGLYAWDRENP